MNCEICGQEITNQRWSINVCSDECFHKHYWLERVNRKNEKTQVVIDGHVYQIGREDSCGDRGFDGRPFAIEFFDARKVVTTNLWANDKVPDEFRDQLPDNAKWGPQEMIEEYRREKELRGIINYESLRR